MILDLATAPSRKTKVWKNTKIEWTDFVKKVSETHRTVETVKEFQKAPKDRRADIKDSAGGYVGGYLTGGRRTAVKHRQIITLDIDFATSELWDDFQLIYDIEALIYSTHSHTPENPRLRFVCPLDRPVSAEEYEAIARKLADDICLDCFDSTTFEPQRLMYWPSTPKDGEYVFRHQEGPVLCADDVLVTYVDWQDITEWPRPAEEEVQINTFLGKQGDPTEKPGFIGAFCRAYDVPAAIAEFLPGVYEECGEDRYTFVGGTTAAGAILYDDGNFLYSHHSTDPAHGKLLNAFDLVRIHKFGDLDKKQYDSVNDRPSHKAMIEFCQKDKKTLGNFTDFDEVLGEEDKEWTSGLTRNRNGALELTTTNFLLILENDPNLKGKIMYDDFGQMIVTKGDLPWKQDSDRKGYLRWSDYDERSLKIYLETTYGAYHQNKLQDCIPVVAKANSFHPVRDFIESEKWDGTPRVDRLMIDVMRAEGPEEYLTAVTRKALVAAVARVYEPGIKFDNVLVMVGAEGIYKSSLIAKLGDKWFSDSFTTVQGKEAYEQLQGVWLIEMAELAGLKKAEVETTKHFISKQVDIFRVAYGRNIDEFPRQCVFFGSTNEDSFLKDANGNRRFWPVRVKGAVMEKIKELNVPQIWAEAKHLYDNGESLYLDKKTYDLAKEIQAGHYEEDDRLGVIQDFLDMKLPEGWDKMPLYERRSYISAVASGEDLLIYEGELQERDKVCVAEIWLEALGQDKKDMLPYKTAFIKHFLRNNPDWIPYKDKKLRFGPHGPNRCFVKKGSQYDETTNKQHVRERA